MLTGIDHLVVAVPDLETAIIQYKALGFTVVPGGRHPIGSHNALIGFEDDSYIELIAFFDPGAVHRWRDLLNLGGGLVDYCAVTDDMQGDILRLRAAGVDVPDRYSLSRARPDGYVLDWYLASPALAHQGVVPFLIEDVTPRHERLPKERRHANGVTGVAHLTLAVADLSQAEAWFEPIFGPGTPIERLVLSARGKRFSMGPHPLELMTPTTSECEMARFLRERGPGLFAVTLKSVEQSGPLDEALALNARFTLALG